MTAPLYGMSALCYDIHMFLVLVICARPSRCWSIYTANKHSIAQRIYSISAAGTNLNTRNVHYIITHCTDWRKNISLLPVWCYGLYLISRILQVSAGVEQKFFLLLKRHWLHTTVYCNVLKTFRVNVLAHPIKLSKVYKRLLNAQNMDSYTVPSTTDQV